MGIFWCEWEKILFGRLGNERIYYSANVDLSRIFEYALASVANIYFVKKTYNPNRMIVLGRFTKYILVI
jgi:hypothetical protein